MLCTSTDSWPDDNSRVKSSQIGPANVFIIRLYLFLDAALFGQLDTFIKQSETYAPT